MFIPDTVTRVLAEHHVNPVLVDVGASGGAPDIWKALAPHATYVGFDPDLREIKTDTAGGYRRGIIINKAVCIDEALHAVPFFLTESPYCSSMLQPNAAALSKYSFASLFRVMQTTSVAATTLNQVVEEQSLDRIDWLKIDAQGADLRIYDSLASNLRNRLLAIDTEPGLMNAYQGEDLFVDVHRRLSMEGFWLADIQVRGVPRISQEHMTKLGISTSSGIPVLEQGRLRSSPGWCEARYFRAVEWMKEVRLGEQEFILAWAFAMVDEQYGHALDVAAAATEQFSDSSLGEKLWRAAADALKTGTLAQAGAETRLPSRSPAMRAVRALARLLPR